MIRAAIVEDNIKTADIIQEYLERYMQNKESQKVDYQIFLFRDAVSFLEPYAGYDLVFMDIKMPYMDGMEAALRLRKMDTQAVLIFVTNMMQYAVKGYEADALDFIIKPVKYYNFAMKLEKALRVCRRRQSHRISVKSGKALCVLEIQEIRYIEVRNHDLEIHMRDEILKVKDSLSRIETQLDGQGFARCSVSYLVNLGYVTMVDGDDVIVAGERLRITRGRKKRFLKELTDYLGG